MRYCLECGNKIERNDLCLCNDCMHKYQEVCRDIEGNWIVNGYRLIWYNGKIVMENKE